jgi:hypothetical protein
VSREACGKREFPGDEPATGRGDSDERPAPHGIRGAPHRLPVLRVGRARPFGPGFTRCASCRLPLLGTALDTLVEVVSLPDALGAHACECGRPEMRVLPDGVFHRPACGAAVLPRQEPRPGSARFAAGSPSHLVPGGDRGVGRHEAKGA